MATIAAMRAPPLLCAALAVASAAATPAWAAPPGPGVSQLHVLEFATDDADDQAKALTLALKARVKASKDYALADGDHALGIFLAQFKCGDVPDVTCQTKIADKLGAERYIWGTLRKSGNQITADLHLWQKGQAEVRQQFTYADTLTEPLDPSLQRLADQMLNKLTSFGKVGTVKLVAPQSLDGELFVDGQSQGKFTNGQSELTLPIGEHRFEVRSGGKLLAQGAGKVSPTTTLDIELAPVKGGEQSAGPGKPASWKRPVGYAGVGVGGALLLGGVYSLFKVNSINKNEGFDAYRKGFGPNDDVCDMAERGRVSSKAGAANPSEVKDFCSSGKTFTTLQYVLFPVGALAAAAGAYLIVTSKEGGDATTAKRRLEVLPSAGPQGGGVDLRVTF